MKWLGGPLD